MRRLIGSTYLNLVAFFILAVFLFAQIAYSDEPQKEDKPTDTDFVFEKIENIEMTKKDIITNSTAFIAERFVSAKSVIKLNDPELGKIVGDVVLMNSNAGFLDAFKGIKTRLVLDAKEGKYRLQASHIIGIDGNGKEPLFAKLEGPNRYRIEPMALSILNEFSAKLFEYLKKSKQNANW